MSTRIAVVGMGYVGIPCAVLLADVDGFEVTGVQRRSKRSGWKIDVLNSGQSPIEGNEPGLDELIARVVDKGTFSVTDDYSVIKDMDIILIDVQTPTDGPDHRPQYLSMKEVSREIGTYIKKGALVIIESTVAPGTTRNVVQPILERKSGLTAGKDFSLAYSYERVMPGRLIDYIVNLPRIVGGIDPESERRAVEMYQQIVKASIHSTDVLTAETTKTMENAYRDANIAFANEMALVCEKLGINVYEVRDLINTRSERHMHEPGSGVGGHCLPKDTWLLRYGLHTYADPSMEPQFIGLARRVNDHMPVHLSALIRAGLEEKGIALKEAKVALLGVAYLEDSDDTRNTPAYAVIQALEPHGVEIMAHDPHVRADEFPQAELTRDLGEALDGADCAVIITKHREYFGLDLDLVKAKMRNAFIVDGRNVLRTAEVTAAGVMYKAIGKGRTVTRSNDV